MKQTSGTGAMDERSLRKLCADWPGVTAEIKWDDDLIFMVAGKMFCGLCVKGTHKGKLAFKVEQERFLEFTDRPGILPAPYMARNKWVNLETLDAWPDDELAEHLTIAREIVAGKLTKKARKELGLD